MKAVSNVLDTMFGKHMSWYFSMCFCFIYGALSLLGAVLLVLSIMAKDAPGFCFILLIVLISTAIFLKTFDSFRKSCKWWNRYWHWWHEKRTRYYSQLYQETKLHYLIRKLDYHIDERDRHLYWMIKA